MRRIAANFMPHLLSKDQEENCVNTCQDIQGKRERDLEFLLKIITGDGTRAYG
jgi:hypothetical protein